jgi:Kdo-III transferase WaaZ
MTSKAVKWIYKTLYRNARGKYYSHNKNLWPYFKTSSLNTATSYRGIEIKKYKSNPHTIKEKPLTLVFTGPSVNSTSQEYFDSDSYDLFGVNGAIAGFQGFRYYCIIDSGFVKNRSDLVKKIISEDKLVLFCSPSVISMVMDIFDVSDVKCYVNVLDIVSNGVCYPFLKKSFLVNGNTNPELFNNERSLGFSSSIDSFVFDYNTVAYVALQISCSLGYKEIYMAGLDMTNFASPRFYETLNNKQPTALEYYFHEIISCFDYAASFCSEKNISVINLSKSSAIRSFPIRK